MDNRAVRSRTNSTSSLRSPLPPATPSHTPNPSFARLTNPQYLSPDQLAAGLSRVRAERGGSRSSSIPATPAPTPNPLLHVSYHVFPEQLAAGISNLRDDEGYVDSASIPATPSASPFSPSPAQSTLFTPDQVAEGIQKLREEGAVSGLSTEQPPTPSTTPRVVNFPGAYQQPLGIIPERLAESINHLRKDEGLESGSNPATPIPTPISPLPATRATQILPEQLAAGIHKLKFEEGMSSGGSSGFPSTPAPTPFVQHPGGVRPEDLAAGISRLSVIEEGVVNPDGSGLATPSGVLSSTKPSISEKGKRNIPCPSVVQSSTAPPATRMEEASDRSLSGTSQPDLSQYFGGGDEHVEKKTVAINEQTSFFDQLNNANKDSVLHSCRESRVDLPSLEEQKKVNKPVPAQPQIEVVEQKFDDEESLNHRHGSEGDSSRGFLPTSDLFGAAGSDPHPDPFANVSFTSAPKSLQADPNAGPSAVNTAESSIYSTPVAATPVQEVVPVTLTPAMQMTSTPNPIVGEKSFKLPVQFTTNEPILSPLLNPGVADPIQAQISVSSADESNPMSEHETNSKLDKATLKRVSRWSPGPGTLQILRNASSSSSGSFYPDRMSLTNPTVVVREDLSDPVRNLVAHYRGESEAAKRNVLTADSVTQDPKGLRKLVRAGCYRAAVNLTARLLQIYNQGLGQGGHLAKHTPSSLQIWFTRIALLMKLKQFSVAEVEAEPFGDLDRPDLYYEYYPDTYMDSTGSMVPFGFRVLLAELPQYLGKSHEALDRLYTLLAKVAKILQEVTKEKDANAINLWKEREIRVLQSLVNSAILQKDFDLAVENISLLIAKSAEEKKAALFSALGRILLQLGDIENAQKNFSQAYQLRNPDQVEDKCDNLLDMAMLYIANNEFQNALEMLQNVDKLDPERPMVVNNIAVCYLYLGRLKEGLSYLEARISNNPAVFLYETPILNLCTLYELESSYAGQKKRSLLDMVSQYKGDGINVSCLKLQT